MSARVWLGIVSLLLNVIVMILNMVSLMMGVYLSSTPDVHKYFLEGSRYEYIVSLIYASGILMMLTNFVGIIACSCALVTSGRGGCGSWLATHMIFLFLFAWLLLATGILLLMETSQVGPRLSVGFNQSIHDYNSSTETKERIDRLQLEYECCGFANLSNWLMTHWINESLIINQRVRLPSGSLFVINAVPFSCCNTSAKTPCAHFPLPTFQEPTIYKTGCAAAVAFSYKFRLFWGFGIGNIVVFVVSIILCVLVRSFSSADSADRLKTERLAIREEKRLAVEEKRLVMAEKRALRQSRGQGRQALGQGIQGFAEGIQPISQGIQPFGQGMQPYGQGIQPFGQGIQPYGQGIQPFGQGIQPFGQGIQPFGQGIQPFGQGMQPFRQGRQPLLETDFDQDDSLEDDEFDDDRRSRGRYSHRRRKHRSHRPRRRHKGRRRSSY